MKVEDYTVLIRKLSEGDGESYEARVREFPDLIVYEDTYAEAYEDAIDSIREVIEDCSEDNQPLPNIIFPNDDYSGRVTLRIAKNLHHYLAQQSQNEGVSLNQYINTLLSFATGYMQSHLDVNFANPSDYWVASVRSELTPKKPSRVGSQKLNTINFKTVQLNEQVN